ncbi:MAG: OmpA family protein [Deltaproteobacteria bacterium]|uniref:OmpA family protein n=1 Tax=Candidatus Zymogenus saltonus TaxID=2844893 RepID=A0A9D8PN09_9DELT|nr:OmpA family protein [Candidatus Zymogenus saltonus]
MKNLAIVLSILLVAFAAVGGYLYLFKYRPAVSKIDSVNDKLFELETRLEKAEADRDVKAARLKEAEEKIEELTDKDKDKTKGISEIEKTYNALIEEMQKEINDGQIEITTLKEELTVNVLDKVLFDSGRTEIKPEGLKVLKRVGDILKEVEGKLIVVEGHTDNVPITNPAVKRKYPTNWELSTARATTVVRYLQEEVGIDPKRLIATGYSEYRPVADNKTDEGKSRNRRIEIILKSDKRLSDN